MCKPLCLNEDGSSDYTLQFLREALAIFKQWKACGQSGLTAETFIACTQSLKTMVAMNFHLINRHGFNI